ncbi:serine hydrolase domain-containing protein [Tardiphaga sp. 839_C3_N1_4]|uniref:serine hydrolase domain-containing protein n=1 Tax=Tardiphaga sp. 839_C3_N1_4 TaxID=3240761 RepID=UPI003F234723
MHWALRLFGFVVAVLALAILGLGGWIVIAHQDELQLASAAAAKTICSNVFMAEREADAILRTDLLALGHPIFRLMKIDVSAADHSVDASLFGFFAKRHAQYVEGRGCTNVLNDQSWDRPAALRLSSTKDADKLWPTGEKAQLSDNARLQAAVNNPVFQGPGMRAIVVVHDGRIVAETYGQGFTTSTPLLGWSMTKSVTAALVGLAIKDGKLSLDQKHLFPQWAGDARSDISVADLMAMSGGLEWNEDQGRHTDPGRMEYLVRDAAAFARDRRLIASPGTKFHYSSGESVLLTRLWQNAIGEGALSYPRERLFNPLGMNSAVIEADEAGTFLGEGFLYANAHDWARFGEFLRLRGEWNGQQLLPAGFVDYMRSPAPASDEGQGPVYGRGQLWLARGQGFDLPADTFMLQGHLRQVIAVIPSRKLVILRMGLTREDIGFSNAKLLRAIIAAGF